MNNIENGHELSATVTSHDMWVKRACLEVVILLRVENSISGVMCTEVVVPSKPNFDQNLTSIKTKLRSEPNFDASKFRQKGNLDENQTQLWTKTKFRRKLDI